MPDLTCDIFPGDRCDRRCSTSLAAALCSPGSSPPQSASSATTCCSTSCSPSSASCQCSPWTPWQASGLASWPASCSACCSFESMADTARRPSLPSLALKWITVTAPGRGALSLPSLSLLSPRTGSQPFRCAACLMLVAADSLCTLPVSLQWAHVHGRQQQDLIAQGMLLHAELPFKLCRQCLRGLLLVLLL